MLWEFKRCYLTTLVYALVEIRGRSLANLAPEISGILRACSFDSTPLVLS
jgi:hypothetical protein